MHVEHVEFSGIVTDETEIAAAGDPGGADGAVFGLGGEGVGADGFVLDRPGFGGGAGGVGSEDVVPVFLFGVGCVDKIINN